MQRNVTLSAEEALVEQAREKAEREGTTLNALFRQWLKRYVQQERAGETYDQLMRRLSHVRSGGTCTREEMNERRQVPR